MYVIRNKPRLTCCIADQWLNCGFMSWFEAESKPRNQDRKENPGAVFGRICHELSKKALQFYQDTGQIFTDWGDDPEIADCAKTYCGYCQKLMDQADSVIIEKRLDFLEDTKPQVDFSCVIEDTLWVVDLKTTNCEIVRPDSSQFLIYAAAQITDKITKIRVRVIQPRLGRMNGIDYPAWTVTRWVEEFAKQQIEAIKSGLKDKNHGYWCWTCPNWSCEFNPHRRRS